MDPERGGSSISGAPPFWKSPQAIFMVVAGLAVAIGGPYFMWRSIGPHSNLSGNGSEDSADSQSGQLTVDPSLDLSELDSLPQSLRDGAMLLLTTDTPEYPDSIAGLPDSTNETLVRPVSEAVFETQPTFYWQPGFGDPPYTVTIFLGSQVVARGGVANTSWTVPTPLPRGGNYTWQLTSAGASARASFRVLDDVESRRWTAVKGAHPNSHLVMGTVAEQLGMLSLAEREYAALVKDYPQSETVTRLLSNIQEMRAQ
ncbi:MAG: hypothetical protein ACRD5L_02875 [Bryobacteraceae bacterium]